MAFGDFLRKKKPGIRRMKIHRTVRDKVFSFFSEQFKFTWQTSIKLSRIYLHVYATNPSNVVLPVPGYSFPSAKLILYIIQKTSFYDCFTIKKHLSLEEKKKRNT